MHHIRIRSNKYYIFSVYLILLYLIYYIFLIFFFHLLFFLQLFPMINVKGISKFFFQTGLGLMFMDTYIMVQLTVHVSVSGLPVSTILYKLILMHKRNKSQNCEFCVL